MAKSLSDYIILLGGHDLEMMEIKKILDEKELEYFDNSLEWGAQLSSYASHFDDQHIFVGIELIADCPSPKQYIEIDHHNLKRDLPSSIEQVAELFGIGLNRDQLLIAANDKGYIPALEAAGAVSDEILKIRKADRDAQGVTEEDERLAKLSIKNHKYNIGNVTVIESLTSKFSAITDNLYPFKELLLRHNSAFTYYGEKAMEFADKYKHLVESFKAYVGGQGNNFFGIDANSFSVEESELLFNEILNHI